MRVGAKAHLGTLDIRMLGQLVCDLFGIELGVARVDVVRRGPVTDLELKALVHIGLEYRELLLLGRCCAAQGQHFNRIGDLALA